MYDMRHPLGSSWRVARECMTATRRETPTKVAASVSGEMDQGLRDRKRRPGNLESDVLLGAMLSSEAPNGTTVKSECGCGGEGATKEKSTFGYSRDPFRELVGFQLTLMGHLCVDLALVLLDWIRRLVSSGAPTQAQRYRRCRRVMWLLRVWRACVRVERVEWVRELWSRTDRGCRGRV